MDLDTLFQTFIYISNAPFFWQTMGFTTAVAMFFGGIIYDGRLDEAKKGIVSVGVYSFMLIWVTFIRVNDTLNRMGYANASMAYAGIVTIIFITIFWLLGVFLGVLHLRNTHRIIKISTEIMERVKALLKHS